MSGNPIDNLPLAVESLTTMPALASLYINLHEEDQVDYLLRSLPRLQYLNGLEVEKDAIFMGRSEENHETPKHNNHDTEANETVTFVREEDLKGKADENNKFFCPESSRNTDEVVRALQ